MKTENSQKLFERAKKVSPGGVHSPVRSFRGVGGTPRFIESAKGAELFDVDGNKYLDFCQAWGPLIFGHQDADVSNAVTRAMAKGWSYGTAEPYSLELAEMMTSNLPWVEQVRFVNSGTEAVMSALRVARAATKRDKVIKFDGCYHGHADSLLVRAGSGLADMSSPDSEGVSVSVSKDTIVAPLDDSLTLQKIFEMHANQIAAVIIEPLPANNGLLIQREEFLLDVIRLAKKYGALSIFDEVISGFRVGFGGMTGLLMKKQADGGKEMYPDLFCYGKVIGGGFPVGAYGGKKEIMQHVAPAGGVYQAGTLSANPVAMSAGIANLKKLSDASVYESLAKKTKYVVSELKAMAASTSYPVHVQSESSIFWTVFGELKTPDQTVRSISQIPNAQKEMYTKCFHALLEKGIYLAPSGYEVSFLSTAHTQDQLDFFLTQMSAVLKTL